MGRGDLGYFELVLVEKKKVSTWRNEEPDLKIWIRE